MKIQLSPKKIVKDALVVWNTHGPEVDIVMDLKNLTFKPESVEEMYAFHVLDHLFPEEVPQAVSNWKKCLKKNSSVFLVVDDFEYVARAFVGGDISIELLNDMYNHPTQFNREGLVSFLKNGGFSEDMINIWFVDVPEKFAKKHYELVLEAKNV